MRYEDLKLGFADISGSKIKVSERQVCFSDSQNNILAVSELFFISWLVIKLVRHLV